MVYTGAAIQISPCEPVLKLGISFADRSVDLVPERDDRIMICGFKTRDDALKLARNEIDSFCDDDFEDSPVLVFHRPMSRVFCVAACWRGCWVITNPLSDLRKAKEVSEWETSFCYPALLLSALRSVS